MKAYSSATIINYRNHALLIFQPTVSWNMVTYMTRIYRETRYSLQKFMIIHIIGNKLAKMFIT